MTREELQNGEGERRLTALRELEDWLETPMLVLSFAWVLLVISELVWGSSELLEVFGTAIWIVFIIEFVFRLALAPDRLRFLKANWLGAIALLVPAFRLFRAIRVLRLARAARGLRLVRVVTTANRGMGALRKSFGRRGLGYVLATTALVILLGAGGMLAFEPATEVDGGFRGYGDALWWTAMLTTSIGSDYWPRTNEGRVLCLLLSVYGLTVFGYITGSFASFFVAQDARDKEREIAGAEDIRALRHEIALLRARLER